MTRKLSSERIKSENSRRCSSASAFATSVMLPEIKISDPEEVEREIRINRIKEINRQHLPFNVTQTTNALLGFARQFRIAGISGVGPRELMKMVRPEVLRLMRENRRTRMILILNSEITRQELFNQQSEILVNVEEEQVRKYWYSLGDA